MEARHRTGGQIVAETLIREGVPYFIGIPGHGCLGLIDAFLGLEDRIRVLSVRQEMAAVHMADGYWRAKGRPLACFTSIGPGAINTAIGLATCFVDSTAALVFTGDTHVYMRGKGVLQEIERVRDSDFIRVIEPVTKRAWLATDVRQLPSILHRAFAAMLTGRPGPVAVSLPMDVQAESADVRLHPPVSGSRAPARPAPDPQAVEEAAELLYGAARPVIIAGGGVGSARAWDELRGLAEAAGAAVVTTLQGKGVFPEDHPLAGWLTGSKGTRCGQNLCRRADVILAVGCRFADETTASYRDGNALPLPGAKLIQIDLDPAEIGKNYPVDVPICADAKLALAALAEAIRGSFPPRDFRALPYLQAIAREREAWAGHLRRWADDAREPMMITCLLREVRRALPRETFVVSSSGNTQAQILQEFAFTVPGTCITSGGFSTMGFSVPAAMGVHLAEPDRPVAAIVGDGDFLMSVQELATAVQYGLPIVVIVANNCGWISIRDLQMAAYGEDRAIGSDFRDREGRPTTPNLAGIAREFGAHGERITRPDQVGPAVRRALESGGPAVVEAMVQQEFPYTGSPAVGWWDVPVPTYLEGRRKKYVEERKEEFL